MNDLINKQLERIAEFEAENERRLALICAAESKISRLEERAETAEQRVKELEEFKLSVMRSMQHYDSDLIDASAFVDIVSELIGDDFSALKKFAIEQEIQVLTGLLNRVCPVSGEVIPDKLSRSAIQDEIEQLRAKGGEK